MKTFIDHGFKPLPRIETEGVRLYDTGDFRYPSVTTVLSIHGKKELFEWRKRVGEAEANRVSARASRRGTSMHSLCEEYLKTSVDPDLADKMPFLQKPGAEMYLSLKPYLDNIDKIHALESPLYSNHLRVAGTVDCIAEYNGKLSVIDFKTSSRVKSKDDIHSYFWQTAAYSYMFWERTGLLAKNLVIMMAVEDEPQGIIFEEPAKLWLDGFIAIRKEYEKKTGY